MRKHISVVSQDAFLWNNTILANITLGDTEIGRAEVQEALAERREWASQAISFWTRILLEVERWGEPIGDVAAANEDFDDAFRGAPPARCSNSECIKYYHLDFAVPVPGQTRIERAIELVLRLRFEGVQLLDARSHPAQIQAHAGQQGRLGHGGHVLRHHQEPGFLDRPCAAQRQEQDYHGRSSH